MRPRLTDEEAGVCHDGWWSGYQALACVRGLLLTWSTVVLGLGGGG